ncbi:quaternary amine ABC transporter ATP-binding protein [Amycolatopsis eburnea]|uniref:quaternary amine ABC transporter ATP-binding protein n=1 Tax=Amycolatopsis eburnea TaxID=2267691 RepID=UPI00177EDED6
MPLVNVAPCSVPSRKVGSPLPTVRAEKLYKVFGRRAQEAVRRLESGTPRDELDGATAAVVDASFEVRDGEIFVVMGLSGSGKSTLLRMLNGLLPATAGRVLVDGQDLTALSKSDVRQLRSKRMSMVFQHFALFPHRTVLENTAYGLRVQGVARDERTQRAEEALRLVGLDGWGDRLPKQLSGGMRQRVGLARALAADTDILLMDEAFSALDPLIRKEMQDQLLQLQATLGKTIVFITHDLNEAMRLGDRIAIMRDGRIVQLGTADEILTTPADEHIARFVRDVDRSRVLTAGSVMRPPGKTLATSSGPRASIHTMRKLEVTEMFAVDPDGGLVGIVTMADAVAAAARGANTVTTAVSNGFPEVPPGTPISELFSDAAAGRPIAVVDERRRLLGAVTGSSVLEALAGKPEVSSGA